MSDFEKASPIDQGVGDNSSNSDADNINDPDAGLSEAEKREAVSIHCLACAPRFLFVSHFMLTCLPSPLLKGAKTIMEVGSHADPMGTLCKVGDI
jgi:hypothetical protein